MYKKGILDALQRASTKIKFKDSELVQDFKQAKIGVADKVKLSEIVLDSPKNVSFGDYTTNFAMVDFRKFVKSVNSHVGETTWANLPHFFKNPYDYASSIKKELDKDKKLSKLVKKIEVIEPGFINFYLSNDVLLNNLIHIDVAGEDFGKGKLLKNKKISVEYTDPNPFKEFHIGHLISNLTGESLAKIFEAAGATVWRADYFGDVGIHVAKSIWGIQKKMDEAGINLSDLENKDFLERIAFMGAGYALGSKAYEEDEKAKSEIAHLNTVLYIVAQKMGEKEGRISTINYDPEKNISDSEVDAIYELYTKGRSWSLEYFETIYKRLGTKFDGYYPESVVGEIGYKLVKDNIGKVFKESEGAVIYEGEKFGLHTRVFINKHNLPTYEAKELGLAPAKYKDFTYDKSVIVVGKEIKEYFSVLVSALKQVNPSLGNVTEPICTGMVTVPSGKMGGRFGNVVTVTSLLEQLRETAQKRMEGEFSESEKDEISEKVAQGALKYAFLKNSIGSDFIFDINSSVSLEGNSGPYLQYTYARTRSVLIKAKIPNSKFQFSNNLTIQQLEKEELSVLRALFHFPEITEAAAANYAPNQICTYLYDLAQKFNTFYNKYRILDPDPKTDKSQPTTSFRLSLTSATGTVLKNGLQLLGISAPERM